MSSSDSEVPSDVDNAVNSATVIPEKSKSRYAKAYHKFEKWCEIKKVKSLNEQVLLEYFDSLKTLKASTLWATYSMLKAELAVRKNIDIRKYPMVIELLKKQSAGYHAKKSMTFTKENLETFINEADDLTFLFAKVAMIIGIAGACRKTDLTYLREKEVSDEGTYFKIAIPETKTKTREFVITNGNLNFVEIIRKYRRMRPHITNHDRFFVRFLKGKCGPQPVGINTIGKLPAIIAQYLGLPNPEAYTGHCFRRSASLIAGTEIVKIQQFGWKSDTPKNNILGETSKAQKQWTPPQIEALIDQYKLHPVLYDPHHERHADFEFIKSSLESIVQNLQPVFPSLNDVDVTVQWDDLLSQYLNQNNDGKSSSGQFLEKLRFLDRCTEAPELKIEECEMPVGIFKTENNEEIVHPMNIKQEVEENEEESKDVMFAKYVVTMLAKITNADVKKEAILEIHEILEKAVEKI